MLHTDGDLFEQLVIRTSEASGIETAVIEKDYYVTLFLKSIIIKQPDIIFKGGTSLSKCYHLIDRFSEDIDLNIVGKSKPTEGQRKRLKENIVAVINDFGFTLTNEEDVKSRRDFNKYIVDYPSFFSIGYLKQHLVVETVIALRAYPHKQMPVASMIYDYLRKIRREDLIEKYHLAPFNVTVQTVERTFIDKIYALGDYYLSNNVEEHSRHIYDIYKLLSVVSLDDSLKVLIKEVAADRKRLKTCLSAQDEIDINSLLQEIVEKDVYKSDYEDITYGLLYKKVDYFTALSAIQKVIDSNIFG